MTDATSGAPDPTDAGAGSGTPPPDPDREKPSPDREREARKHRRHVVIAWIASVFGVLLVAAVIAGLAAARGTTAETIGALTTANAQRIFGAWPSSTTTRE